jgi:hypothetical protein
MSPDRRQILEQVARGELTPEEADELLRDGDGEAGAVPAAADATPISKVIVRAGAGALEIIGDSSVSQVDVDGPHRASMEGDTLVIRGDLDSDVGFPGAFAINVGRRRARRVRVSHRGIVIGDNHHVSALRIRMNPSLELDAELDAGPLSITDVRGAIRARLSAGPMTIERFEGPLDVSVNAGAIRAVGKLTHGDSRVRSDAGAVRVRLDPSSDVHITAHAALGKVSLLSSEPPAGRRFGTDRRHEATLGSGEATLRVDTAMGSVHVSVDH